MVVWQFKFKAEAHTTTYHLSIVLVFEICFALLLKYRRPRLGLFVHRVYHMSLFGYMSSQKVSLDICCLEVSYVASVYFSNTSWIASWLEVKFDQELFGFFLRWRLLSLSAVIIDIVSFVDVVVDREVFPILDEIYTREF